MAQKTVELTLNEFSLYRLGPLQYLFDLYSKETLDGEASQGLEALTQSAQLESQRRKEDMAELNQKIRNDIVEGGKKIKARLASSLCPPPAVGSEKEWLPYRILFAKIDYPQIKEISEYEAETIEILYRAQNYFDAMKELSDFPDMNLGLIHTACIKYIGIWCQDHRMPSECYHDTTAKLKHGIKAIHTLSRLVFNLNASKIEQLFLDQLLGANLDTEAGEVGKAFQSQTLLDSPMATEKNTLLDKEMKKFEQRLKINQQGTCFDYRHGQHLRNMLAIICRSITHIDDLKESMSHPKSRGTKYRKCLGAYLLQEYLQTFGLNKEEISKLLGKLYYGMGYFDSDEDTPSSFKEYLLEPKPTLQVDDCLKV